MPSLQFRFSNLCGTVYKYGNILFTPDGNTLISPVGNRVTCFDLLKHTSYTLPCENRSDVELLALSNSGRSLLSVDNQGRALIINFHRRVVVHRFNFRQRVRAARFSPDDSLLAVATGNKVYVWEAPKLVRQMAPFHLRRTFTGHHDVVTCIAWSPSSEYVATGSRDATVRIHAAARLPGFVPVTLSGHRGEVVRVSFFDSASIWSVSRDGGVLRWEWVYTAEDAEINGGRLVAVERAARQAGMLDEDEDEDSEEEEEDESEDEEASSGGDSDGASGQVPPELPTAASSGAGGDSGLATAAGRAFGGSGRAIDPSGEPSSAVAVSGRKRSRADREQGTASKRSSVAASAYEREDRKGRGLSRALDQRRTYEKHPVVDPRSSLEMARSALEEEAKDGASRPLLSIAIGEWRRVAKHVFLREGARINSCALHPKASMLVVGFSDGVFGLYSLPSFEALHTLSIATAAVTAAAINPSGEWLAFGSAEHGQLLVWEWQSEQYILRQQGHYHDIVSHAYSPDGQSIATGADDGKVKLWSTQSGFCFVTFSEHKAPVTGVAFMGGKQGRGQAVVTSSLDGTVRAFDLVRYRNFRTFSAPKPTQFTCVAVDPEGEVVCAGSMEPFHVYVWSVRTGKLLDALAGHEGPVATIAFSPTEGLIATGSWDATARVWDVYRSGTATQTFGHTGDVLAVAFRPDGKQLCTSSRDGKLQFWDVDKGRMEGELSGKRDAASGRSLTDMRSAKNSAKGKAFSTIDYSPDGEMVIAGGRSRYVCLYASGPRMLLRKYQVSHNRSLDAMVDKLDSRKQGEHGKSMELMDGYGSDDDQRAAAAAGDKKALPGAKRGDATKRTTMPEIRTRCVRFSPTGRAWSAATTDGLAVFSLDETLAFDPFELDIEATPANVGKLAREGQHSRAVLVALHLNEPNTIDRALTAVPSESIRLVSASLPAMFVPRLLSAVARRMQSSTRIEHSLAWSDALLFTHGKALRYNPAASAGPAREILRAAGKHQASLGRLTADNVNQIEFLTRMAPPEFTAVDMVAQATAAYEREQVLRSIAKRAAEEAGLDVPDDDAVAGALAGPSSGAGADGEGTRSGYGEAGDDDDVIADACYVLQPGSAEMAAMLAKHGLTEADIAGPASGGSGEGVDGQPEGTGEAAAYEEHQKDAASSSSSDSSSSESESESESDD